MPELPEVETVRRTLQPLLVGRRIARVELRRADIVEGDRSVAALLEGATIRALVRRGKQLAIVGEGVGEGGGKGLSAGRVLIVHLGMTGQLVHHATRPDLQSTTHVHALWTIESREKRGGGVLTFRDPRRFGGLWPLANERALHERWASLGPDGLEATADGLRERAGTSRRAIKAALLDQGVIAGVGNIYADESLHRAGIRPTRACHRIKGEEWSRLAAEVRAVLLGAIASGGSTLRDYVGGTGRPGAAQLLHAVYGRGGEPCLRCGLELRVGVVGQRTTVWCRGCQR